MTHRNLETISGFNRDLSVKRPRSVGRASPRPTLRTVGPFGSRSESIDLLARPGSWEQCAPEIRQIQAVTPTGTTMVNDEWRHHIYRRRLIVSTPAHDDTIRLADHGGQARNVEKARAVIAELPGGFATSFVLDTCTLTNGDAAVVEANSFFASGICTKEAIHAIAEAIAGT